MKKINPYAIFGGVVILIFGYYLYKKTRSRKAIEQVKDDELANTPTNTTQTTTTPEIPKMYIRAGVNVPAGAMSFIDDNTKVF